MTNVYFSQKCPFDTRFSWSYDLRTIVGVTIYILFPSISFRAEKCQLIGFFLCMSRKTWPLQNVLCIPTRWRHLVSVTKLSLNEILFIVIAIARTLRHKARVAVPNKCSTSTQEQSCKYCRPCLFVKYFLSQKSGFHAVSQRKWQIRAMSLHHCTASSSLVHIYMIRHICICLCIWYMIWRGRYTWQTQSQVVVNLMSISWAWQTDDKMIGHNENQEARRCLKIAFKYFHIYQVQIWWGYQLNEFNIHWGKILRAWIFPRIPLFLCSFLCHVFTQPDPHYCLMCQASPKDPK